MKIAVRAGQPEDRAAVRRINEAAFGGQEEAEIVYILRESCSDLLSLLAIADRQVVGHILFSPVTSEGVELHPEGMGLAPMAGRAGPCVYDSRFGRDRPERYFGGRPLS